MKIGSKLVTKYITDSAPQARPMLRILRQVITTAVPDAVEGISYGMPYYHYHGRLAYFAAFTNHVSLFAWGQPMKKYAKELKKYQTSKGTVQFPFGTKIPMTLVKKLVRARLQENLKAKKGR